MKKLVSSLCLLVIFSCHSYSQQKNIRLLVRGDDMGYSHAGNVALIDCYKNGIERSIEVIVPSPWFPEAVKMLAENPTVDVGIHLALTAEWDNVKWRPLTDCPSLRDADGYFFPMINPNKNYPGRAIKENNWQLKDVEKEFRAQIELALKKIPRISHISSHMGCTGLNDSTKALAKRLAIEYKIDKDPAAVNAKGVSYNGPHASSEEKIESFIKMLDKLEPGNTYVFVDHPGLNNAEVQAIQHIGYETVAVDRQGVTDCFTNEKVKAAIKKKGIELIAYRDL